MNKNSITEIENLVTQFSKKLLQKEKWTHDAHITVALWYNFNYNFENALNLIRTKIKAYNISVGTPNTENSGYHETLTVFWMVLTSNFLKENRFDRLEEACANFFKTEMASKYTPLRYYTKELLFSKQARSQWINGNIKKVKVKENIEAHFQLSDEEFVKQFSNCTLNPELFSHEAHLRLAWLLIDTYGLKKTEVQIQELLRNFVTHVGAQDKYHVTITLIAMKIMNHFMQKSNTNNFKDFIAENIQLKINFNGLIGSHYSFDLFKSTNAKREFVEPDLFPF